jgi:AhpD family alkylhydroperoxidase
MSKDFVQIANDVITGVGMLRQGSPDVMRGFASLATAATASNAIDTKTKELMAVAIGIVIHCDGCIAYHTKMAHQHGATKQEFSKPSLSPSTWEVNPRRYMEPMRCAHTINSPFNPGVSDNMAGHDQPS